MLMQNKCSYCGVEIDLNKETNQGECPNCHSKMTNKKVITVSTDNSQTQTEGNLDKSYLNEEKKQCDILLMMLQKFDLLNLKSKF